MSDCRNRLMAEFCTLWVCFHVRYQAKMAIPRVSLCIGSQGMQVKLHEYCFLLICEYCMPSSLYKYIPLPQVKSIIY